MHEDSAGDKWEKAETSSGILYYVNHKGKKTQWEHPKYAAALSAVNECNSIKYAAYRTAAKMCALQKILGLDKVRLGLIAGVFRQHRIQVLENSLQLDYSELEAILSDIFFAASKESRLNSISYDVDHFTELTLNFLISVFDRNHDGSIQVLGIKVALVSLSCSRLQEKYQYLFNQLADHNNCLSKRKLKQLLENFVLITDYLFESLAFSSSLIPDTLESCFENESNGPLGVSEENFMCWVLKEPQLLVWLSTFYRLRAAENVTHPVRCAACRVYPIRGLRYRCLHCITYDQCQMCFFHGRISKKHKLKHPMQEYCWQTSHKEATVSFLKALVNRLCGNTSRLQYLPAQPCDSINSDSLCSSSISGSSGTSTTIDLEPDVEHQTLIVKHKNLDCVDGDQSNSDIENERSQIVPWVDSSLHPQKELQSIINKLEAENRQLELDIDRLCGLDQGRVGHSLKEHRALIEAQVRRLKILKQHLQSIVPKAVQSTPITVHNSAALAIYKSPHLSPIQNNHLWADRTTNYEERNDYTLSEVTPKRGCVSKWTVGKNTVLSEPRSGFFDWLGTSENMVNPTTTLSLEQNKTSYSEGHIQDKTQIDELQHGLDNILIKLQNMLASNFSLAEDASFKENY